LGNAYHGDTLGSVSVGGISRFHAMFEPLLFDTVRGPCPDSYRLPDGVHSGSACGHYLEKYAKLLEQYAGRVAAVIAEPLVQGAAGMVMYPPGFLQGLRALASRHGALLIADEIAVGMGRTGKMWASQWESVIPDIQCTGKGLSGGYLPVAATLTTRQIWNAFCGDYSQSRSLFHGHTYGGNPLGCAAALATLELFEQERTLENVERQSHYLSVKLERLRALDWVGDIRQKGLLAAVELVSDRATKLGFPWTDRIGHRVCQAALDKGVWLRPLGNVIVAMPPLCSQAEHLDQLVDAIEYGIRRVQSS
jgi:adenosylmethionine-8-amino-7-oxononanoate aminotransferase